MIAESIRHAARNLGRFSGRDRPGLFWPYAIIAFLGGTAVMAIGMMLLIVRSMRRIQVFAQSHPDQVTITSNPGRTSIQVHGHHPERMPAFGSILIACAIAAAIVTALLAAAVTRRLHDTGRSGCWGLVPVALLSTGVSGMGWLLGRGDVGGIPLLLLFLNNMVYLGSVALLVVFLVLPGTSGPNRFGDQAVPS